MAPPIQRIDLDAPPSDSVQLTEALKVPNSLDGLHDLLVTARLLIDLDDAESAQIVLGYGQRLVKVLGGERA